MGLTFHLYFTRVGGTLRLEQTRFWRDQRSDNGPPDSEMNAAASGLGGDNLFRWDSTERALCVLFLRAFVHIDPTAWPIEQPLAQGLYDVLRSKHTKGAPDEPTWIQKMFPGFENKRERRLPPRLFYKYGNTYSKHFKVSLGSEWKGASLGVYLDYRPVKQSEFLALADELEKISRRPTTAAFQVGLDLQVWHGTVKGYVSVLHGKGLPAAGGTPFQLRLSLDRPAWFLPVWIDGRGTSAPMGKSRWQSWKNFRFLRSETAGEWVLPITDTHEEHGHWCLDKEASAETIVLVASEVEPDAYDLAQLASSLGKLRPHGTKGKGASSPIQLAQHDKAILRTWSRTADRAKGERGLPWLAASPINEPIEAWVRHIGSALPPHFDNTVLLSFANAGTEHSQL